MKRLSLNITVFAIIIAINACVKADNFEAPEETLTGKIIDVTTGEPIQIESGGGGIQIRYHDLTWAERNGTSATQFRSFNCKPDGTFNNTKMFEGNYKIYPYDGPFVPLYSENATAPVDLSKTVYVNGVTEVEFQVEPFLKIEWVEEPILNADRTVTAKIKITRGTSNPTYTAFALTDAWLCVSTTPFASFASRVVNMSNQATPATGLALGTTVTITSKAGFPLDQNRTYYVRVGARTNDNVQKRYNYNKVKEVKVP
jgi:hypothetical protein